MAQVPYFLLNFCWFDLSIVNQLLNFHFDVGLVTFFWRSICFNYFEAIPSGHANSKVLYLLSELYLFLLCREVGFFVFSPPSLIIPFVFRVYFVWSDTIDIATSYFWLLFNQILLLFIWLLFTATFGYYL